MENTKLIDFKRERELGEVLSDTFNFIRYNYKILSKVLIKLVGPVLIVLLLALAGYTFLVMGQGKNIFTLIENQGQIENEFEHFGFMVLVGALFFIVATVLYYSVLYATINFSIKSYIENNGEIKIDEVSANVRQTWGGFLGLSFLAGLILFVGTMLCFIPGIYLFVPMSLVFSIKAFHNLSTGDSISYSFKLIKSNWWISFFTLFIIGIIFYLMSAIFNLPAIIYSLVKTMTVSKSITQGGSGNPFEIFDWIYILLSLIAGLARFILYSLVVISSVFIYFNLNEKKNQTGAFETIDSLGGGPSGKTPPDLPKGTGM